MHGCRLVDVTLWQLRAYTVQPRIHCNIVCLFVMIAADRCARIRGMI